MTPEQRDEIAAICYPAIWQIEESNPVLNAPAEEGDSDQCLSTEPFKKIFMLMGYPNEPIYGNELEPVITWESEFFNNLSGKSAVYTDVPSLFTETLGD